MTVAPSATVGPVSVRSQQVSECRGLELPQGRPSRAFIDQCLVRLFGSCTVGRQRSATRTHSQTIACASLTATSFPSFPNS
jgi:hypothetical protein